jgi:hypothetical protein
MEGFDRAALVKAPLAEATLLLLAHATREPFLEDLYDRHRGRCYEKSLSFSTLVRLIGDALIQHGGSGQKSCDHAAEQGQLPVTASAFYRKLARVPLAVTRAMLSETALRIAPLAPTPPSDSIPASLRGMTLLPIDGKKIKNVAKRAKVLRGLPGSVLGAKVLVAMRLEDGLAVAMEADPDGEANDCPLVAGLLAQVRRVVPGVLLLILDRQFCGAEQLDEFAAEGNHYLVRRTTTARFTPDPDRPAREGTDAGGRRYVDCCGTLFTKAKARRVRQITLTRPGEDAVILITDLLDEEAFPAVDLLEAYLRRWGIERVFQQITEVFSLASLIGSTPEAAVFQCGFCLLLYNAIRVVKDLVAVTHGREPEEVSLEKVFCDARDQLTALRVMGVLEAAGARSWPSRDEALVRAELSRLLGGTWSDRWRKAPPKKKAPAVKKPKRSGAHTSVLRARQAYERRQKAGHADGVDRQ